MVLYTLLLYTRSYTVSSNGIYLIVPCIYWYILYLLVQLQVTEVRRHNYLDTGTGTTLENYGIPYNYTLYNYED